MSSSRSKRVVVRLTLASGLIFAVSGLTANSEQAESDKRPVPPAAIILPPKVVFEQLSAKAHDHDLSAMESALTERAAVEMRTRGYALVSPDSIQNPDAIDCLKRLQTLTSRLVRGAFNDEAQQIMNRLASLPEEYVILVQFVRVKDDSGGTWNPINGAITSGMPSTLLQASLISTRTGQIVWKNEVLERRLLNAGDSKFDKTVTALYKSLDNSGRKL